MTSTRRDRWAKGTTYCRSLQWRHWKVMKLYSSQISRGESSKSIFITFPLPNPFFKMYGARIHEGGGEGGGGGGYSLVWLERVPQYSIAIFVKDLRAVRPRAVHQGLFVERTLLDGAEPGILVGWVELSPDKYPQGQQSSGEYTQIGALLQKSPTIRRAHYYCRRVFRFTLRRWLIDWLIDLLDWVE